MSETLFEPPASVAVTTIECVPTFALVGVPEITPADVAVIVLGAPVIANVIESSTSAKLLAMLRL